MQAGWQLVCGQRVGNGVRFGRGAPAEFRREARGHDEADGDGFTVQVGAVTSDSFNGVTESMSEVEQRAAAMGAGFAFIAGHDARLDLDAATNDAREERVIPSQGRVGL